MTKDYNRSHIVELKASHLESFIIESVTPPCMTTSRNFTRWSLWLKGAKNLIFIYFSCFVAVRDKLEVTLDVRRGRGPSYVLSISTPTIHCPPAPETPYNFMWIESIQFLSHFSILSERRRGRERMKKNTFLRAKFMGFYSVIIVRRRHDHQAK